MIGEPCRTRDDRISASIAIVPTGWTPIEIFYIATGNGTDMKREGVSRWI